MKKFASILGTLLVCAALSAQTNLNPSCIVVPDTQNEGAEVLTAMKNWIVAHKTSDNVQCVIGVGDITNYATPAEFVKTLGFWGALRDVGLVVVPVVGNHDYNDIVPASRSLSRYDTYYGPQFFAGKPWYVGNYPTGSNANFAVRFAIGDRKILIVALEFFPRPGAISWANSIVAANQDAEVIVTTHGYLNFNGSRTLDNDPYGPNSYALPSADNNGEDMWRNFVSLHKNIRLVVCGHQLGKGAGIWNSWRADVGVNGNTVRQTFQNWQEDVNGGDGWVGKLDIGFNSDTGLASIGYLRTYNPTVSFGWPAVTQVISPPTVDWYADWGYRADLSIPTSQIQGIHTGFPLRVKLQHSDLRSATYGGKVGQVTGGDILFTDATNTKIPHELIQYDPLLGLLDVRVRIPNLSSTSTTPLRMYFGSASTSSQADKVATWGNETLAMWHLEEQSGSQLDSSVGANHLSVVNALRGVPGIIGLANAFSSPGHYAQAPSGGSLKQSLTRLTVSAWVSPSQHAGGTWGPTVISNTDGAGWALRIWNGQLAPDIRVNTDVMPRLGPVLPLNTYSHVLFTYDGATLTGYVNGVSVGSVPASGAIRTGSNGGTCTFIGNDPSGCSLQTGDPFSYKGNADEILVRGDAVSADWVSLYYRNLLNPELFATLGAVTVRPQ